VTTTSPRSTDRVSVTLVGCGSIVAQAHAPALEALSDQLVVERVVDVAEARRDELGDRFSVPSERRLADVRELTGGDAGHLAVVAVPTPVLAATVRQVAAAGFTVLAEKPVGSDAGEAEQAAAAGNVRVVHNYLWRNDVTQARALVDDGAIGDVTFIRLEQFDRTHYRGSGAEPDWRRSGRRGCLLDTAYHWVYVAEHLARSPVTEVTARLAAGEQAGAETLATLILAHASGAVTSVQVGWGMARAARVLEVHGTAGSIELPGGGRGCVLTGADGTSAPADPVVTESSYLRLYREVAGAMRRGDAEFGASPADCLRVLAVVDAAYRAHEAGRTLVPGGGHP
jgi:predicted dehydrogenase